jgi:hypothetical protein
VTAGEFPYNRREICLAALRRKRSRHRRDRFPRVVAIRAAAV